jgi:hypothetical protein
VQKTPEPKHEEMAMSSFGSLVNTFERMMAAVAFAEYGDRETACWIMRSESADARLRAMDEARRVAARQPELRL